MIDRNKYKITKNQVIDFDLENVPTDNRLITKILYPFPDDEKMSYEYCYFES